MPCRFLGLSCRKANWVGLRRSPGDRIFNKHPSPSDARMHEPHFEECYTQRLETNALPDVSCTSTLHTYLSRHFGWQENVQSSTGSTPSSLEDLKDTSMISECRREVISNKGVTETLRGGRAQKSASFMGPGGWRAHGGERLLRPNLKRWPWL